MSANPLILTKVFLLFVGIYTCVTSFFTNTLILPTINGPTEGLMLIYVSHLFTFLTGNNVPYKQILICINFLRISVTFLIIPISELLLVCSLNLGAEWWAHDFRKSLPFFGWIPLPFLSGMYYWIYELTSPCYANTALVFPLCLIGMIFDYKIISICDLCYNAISVSLIISKVLPFACFRN